MGKAISSVIDSVDRSEQKKQQQAQTLEILQNMAKTSFELWQATINRPTGSAKLMEADVILRTQYDIYCQVSTKDDIGPTITDIVSGFTQGPLVQGVTSAITKMFSKVIQTTKSGMTQKTSTLTILGSMGSVIRFDYFAYAYNFMNIGLEQKENKVVLWSYMISAIDVQKITNVNAFKSLIDLQYHDLDLGAKEKLLKLIYEGLDISVQKNHSLQTAFSLNFALKLRPLQTKGSLMAEQILDFNKVDQLTGKLTYLAKQAFKTGINYVGYMFDMKLKTYLTIQRTSKNFVFASALQYSNAIKFTMFASGANGKNVSFYSEIGGKKYYLVVEQDGKVTMQGDQPPKDKFALNWNSQSNEMFQVYSKKLGSSMGISDQQEIDKQISFKSSNFDIQFGFVQINKDQLSPNKLQIFQNYQKLYPTVWKHKLKLQ